MPLTVQVFKSLFNELITFARSSLLLIIFELAQAFLVAPLDRNSTTELKAGPSPLQVSPFDPQLHILSYPAANEHTTESAVVNPLRTKVALAVFPCFPLSNSLHIQSLKLNSNDVILELLVISTQGVNSLVSLVSWHLALLEIQWLDSKRSSTLYILVWSDDDHVQRIRGELFLHGKSAQADEIASWLPEDKFR